MRNSGARNERLALLEILGELFRRRLRNIASLLRPKHDVIERPQFVQVTILGVDSHGRRRKIADQGTNDLLTQELLALLGHVTAFGKTGLTNQIASKRARSNWPVMPRNDGSLRMRCRDHIIWQIEAERADILVDGSFRQHLPQHLPGQAERPRLIRWNRTTDLTDELLQPLIVGFCRNCSRPISVLPIFATVD